MQLVPTENFEQTAKELLSAGELLMILETIEEDPWGGVTVVIDSEEFGDRIRFAQFPLKGMDRSRKGHFVKVLYAIFDDGERVILMNTATETQWDRWLRNQATRGAILAGLRFIARRVMTGV
ncbi:hypothetical protein J7443_22715 [Tropicibacter sp. R15_0]|uniref:hypothetical protein n=1 Tax=Tropicibacter sp. R15_0 TaxID=2821101 RepID=UPI001ADCAD68|nr:hypothetical protein [Tropicibacter sp. R15_0]MBO9468057.1 hypothetical protein [Tropicibacter sp. R15_0]